MFFVFFLNNVSQLLDKMFLEHLLAWYALTASSFLMQSYENQHQKTLYMSLETSLCHFCILYISYSTYTTELFKQF